MPRRSGSPRVDEVESRGWGRRAPQSPSSSSFGAPQGNNEIYTYDVVFSPGEARKKIQSQTPLPLRSQNSIPQSLPVECGCHVLTTAVAPRRVRMTPSAARERSSHVLDGTILGSTRTCTNYIHPHPHIKVLRSFFKSARSPVPLVPPPASYIPRPIKAQ